MMGVFQSVADRILIAYHARRMKAVLRNAEFVRIKDSYGSDGYDKLVDESTRGLVEIGVKTIPVLVKHLKSDDDNVRLASIRALGAIGDLSAIPELLDAADACMKREYSKPVKRSVTAEQLIRHREGKPVSVNPLDIREQLGKVRKMNEAGEIAIAFGRISDANRGTEGLLNSTPSILDALSRIQYTQPFEIFDLGSRLPLATAFPPQPRPPQASKQVPLPTNPQWTINALSTLSAAPPPSRFAQHFIPYQGKRYQIAGPIGAPYPGPYSHEYYSRMRLNELAGKIVADCIDGRVDIILQLAKRQPDNPAKSVRILNAIGNISDPSAIPALIELLGHREKREITWGYLGEESAGADRSELSKAAMRGLGNIGAPAVPALVAVLREGPKDARLDAANAIHGIPMGSLTVDTFFRIVVHAFLHASANDADYDVRQASAGALSRLMNFNPESDGIVSSLPAILKLAYDDAGRYRLDIIAALPRVAIANQCMDGVWDTIGGRLVNAINGQNADSQFRSQCVVSLLAMIEGADSTGRIGRIENMIKELLPEVRREMYRDPDAAAWKMDAAVKLVMAAASRKNELARNAMKEGGLMLAGERPKPPKKDGGMYREIGAIKGAVRHG